MKASPEKRSNGPTWGKIGRPKRSVTAELNQSLLGLATEALRKSDYNEISLGGLAERIGVSKPTLYRRFGSKDGLILAMVEAEFSRTLTVPPGSVGEESPPLETLKLFASGLFEVFISPGTANFVRFQNQESVDSPAVSALRRKIHLALLENLAQLISLVQKEECLPPTDPKLHAALLVAQLQSPGALYSLGFAENEVLQGLTPTQFFEWRFDAFLLALRGLNNPGGPPVNSHIGAEMPPGVRRG